MKMHYAHVQIVERHNTQVLGRIQLNWQCETTCNRKEKHIHRQKENRAFHLIVV